jgi:putative flavoprotein involved in K+ transport
MRRTTTVIIGAGHAGLAMSRCLSERGIDHVVLERGEVANSWRTERWDSLRLLTPNWQSRLPGFGPDLGPDLGNDGDDPDGFRTMPEVIALIERYAQRVAAPVQTGTRVTSVRRTGAGYLVRTDGGVLVVGASATGIQLADEIHRSGRPVTLAVGEHIRAPRTYRGRDIQWWMDAAGVLDQRHDEVDDIERARRVPSLQLVGSPERRMLDLNALSGSGIRLVGRLAGISGGSLQFSGSLANQCALSDLKMGRLLDAIDQWATDHGLDGEVGPPHRFAPTRVDAAPPLGLDLRRGEIRTIVFATGYRPDYAWLEVPVLDRKGRIRHDGGVVAAPGMYVIGLPFLRRRKSALLDGAAADARDLSAHLAAYLDGRFAEAAAA